MKTASKKTASKSKKTPATQASKKTARQPSAKIIGDKPRTMKIFDLVLEKKTAMEKDAKVAHANKNLAVAAVTGGLGSPAWEAYMRQFISNDDPEQLSRLLATDGTIANPDMIVRRAYLVSNGVCGEGTKGHFDQDVHSIDAGLEDEICLPDES